jgi:Na+/proline symporter
MAAASASSSSTKVIILAVTAAAALFTLPTVLVLMVGMLPTLAAMLTDRRRERYTTLCVGCMNFVGVMPFVAELWTKDHSFDKAFKIMLDPFAWLSMLGAAGIGWCIYFVAPSIVAMYMAARIEQRIASLRRRQRELVEEWGPGVAGSSSEAEKAEEGEVPGGSAAG